MVQNPSKFRDGLFIVWLENDYFLTNSRWSDLNV
jgi:hypothetical protein